MGVSFVGSTLVGVVVALAGFVEARSFVGAESDVTLTRLGIATAIGLAVGLARHRPGSALVLTWLVGLTHLVTGTDAMVFEVAVAGVAYGCARHGRVLTVWLAGSSIPAALALGTLHVREQGTELATRLGLSQLATNAPEPLAVLVLGAATPLALPWLLGMTLRMRARAAENRERQLRAETVSAEAEQRRAQAEELAAARAEQAQLARDVHDVVGHSLAVILAQAESATYLPDPAPEPVRQILANIAASARGSLIEVRNVLTDQRAATSAPGSLTSLLQQARAARPQLRSVTSGHPQPLPPDLAVAAYRVLQEMMTNALKHGDPHGSVEVTQDWTDTLTMTVKNTTLSGERGDGLGLTSLGTRVAAAGGSLRIDDRGDLFAVTADLPLRGSEPLPGRP